MFTEEQLSQLRELLSPLKEGQQRLEHGQVELRTQIASLEKGQASLEKGQASLEKGQQQIEERLTSVETQLQIHIQQSQKQHDDIVALILDTTEVNDKAYKKKLEDHEERISTIEKQVHSA